MKLDDFYFINTNTGWLIKGIDPIKKVYKTLNAGNSWDVIFQSTNMVFRSIAFRDSMNGFIGTLDNDALLKSSDGGKTWKKETNFIGDDPRGICGLYLLDSLNIYGCGRYDKPAYFIKTSDGGHSWISTNLSSQASLLVDCYFFNKKDGILVGGQTIDDYHDAYPKILCTSDSGNSWNVSYTGDSNGEIFWKIHFIDSMTGFVSLQTFKRNTNLIKYLSTTNGGKNWIQKQFQTDAGYYESLGIFFLNENSGIIGGMRYLDNGNVEGESYFTTNSGSSWFIDTNYINLNRIKLNNNNILASGKSFYNIKFP
ncbi:MAG: YCF48-related protein [Ignavibacteria bacterium]